MYMAQAKHQSVKASDDRIVMPFYVTPEQRRVLKVFAAQRDIPLQQVMRLAVDEHLARHGHKALFK